VATGRRMELTRNPAEVTHLWLHMFTQRTQIVTVDDRLTHVHWQSALAPGGSTVLATTGRGPYARTAEFKLASLLNKSVRLAESRLPVTAQPGAIVACSWRCLRVEGYI
jgi:hypothetical protein